MFQIYCDTDRHRVVVSRRAVLVSCTGILTGLSFIESSEAGVSFGLTPVFLDNDMRFLTLFENYLTRRLGRPVALVRRRSQRETIEMLLSGQLQAAWISDLAYVEFQNRLTVLAVPVFENHPSYQAYIIVNRASAARTFDDIRGTRHAFSDPDTTAGYFMTRWVLSSRQEMPASFFRHFFFTYADRNTVRAVATGLAESGSVNGYVWEVMKRREPDLADQTRVIFRSEPLGFPPIAALERSNGLHGEQELETALLSMNSQPVGPEILSRLVLDGFTTLLHGSAAGRSQPSASTFI
jgi:phosphonate transport system substrate-binding protein